MKYTYSFEKLEVWKLSIDLVKEVYRIVKKFPRSEQYGLSSQMRRAVISIPANIAEGSARTSSKDQVHYYQIAYSSANELLCEAIIAKELYYITEDEYYNLREKIEEVTNKINSLRKSKIQK